MYGQQNIKYIFVLSFQTLRMISPNQWWCGSTEDAST